jgi:hypothetical protein
MGKGLADLPADLLQGILGALTRDGEVDFLVTTTSKAHDEPGMPMQGIGVEHDLVVRGIPVGDTLYITHVYGKDDPNIINASRPPVQASETAEEKAEWYGPLRRNPNGRTKWVQGLRAASVVRSGVEHVDLDALTAAEHGAVCSGAMHYFYADDVTRRLHITPFEEDIRLVKRQHDLTPLLSERGTPWLVANDSVIDGYAAEVRARRSAIEHDDAFAMMPIEGSRANKRPGHPGTKLLLALNHSIKLYASSPIIASMPILSRVSPPTPADDRLAAVPALQSQLTTTNRKWLACVPIDWIYQWQSDARMANGVGNGRTRYVPFPPNKQYAKVGSTAERVRDLFDPSVKPANLPPMEAQLRLTHRSSHNNAHSLCAQRRALRTIPGTSFDVVAPLLVHTFLAHGEKARNLNDPAVLDELLALADVDSFCRENDIEGNLVRPTPPGGRARGRTLAEVDALFDGQAGLSIFGAVMV